MEIGVEALSLRRRCCWLCFGGEKGDGNAEGEAERAYMGRPARAEPAHSQLLDKGRIKLKKEAARS